MSSLPRHVAIIMDGNGRWAQNRGLSRFEGHRAGVDVVERIITAASNAGIECLTLYAFSSENWGRPPEEVEALMMLLSEFLKIKKEKMLRDGIRLHMIGDKTALPQSVQQTLDQTILETRAGKKMILTLALSYGARDEILRAIKKIHFLSQYMEMDIESLDEDVFSEQLDTAGLPDPDLIIRTSGEKRISNFLLWQGAYAEYYFEDCLWPDFSEAHFQNALDEYAKRERRFGKILENE